MHSISINYVLKYELSFSEKYKWTRDGKCFNVITGRQIKKVMCGRSIGYCIDGKFYSLNTLRKNLIEINKYKLPF